MNVFEEFVDWFSSMFGKKPKPTPTPTPTPPAPTPTSINGVSLGIYDNNKTFTTAKDLAYELIWTWWNTTAIAGWLLPQLQAIQARGRTPIVTIEPWPIASIGMAATLLSDITAGKYDTQIRTIATDVKNFGLNVVIRFAHEMETTNYPWGQNVYGYIAAYNHVVSLFRSIAPNTMYMWSPAGDSGCAIYYPGAANVDYLGLSVYNYPAFNALWYGGATSFAQIMGMKYPRISALNKPLFVAETGCISTVDQAAWIKAAFAAFPQFPLLRAFVYFNAQDSSNWGMDLPNPNWSISPSSYTIS